MNSELKIKTKLLIGFGIIVFSLVLVALTALLAISSLSANVDSLLNKRLGQLKSTASISEAVRTSALTLNDAYLLDGADAVQKELETTAYTRKVAVDNMAKLKATLLSEKGRQLYQNVVDKRTPYAAERDKIIKLLKEGKKAEALEEFKIIKPMRNEFVAKALKELDEYVQEQARLDGEATTKSAGTARLTIFVLVAGSLVVTLLVAIWIIGSISGPLGAAVKTANRIAERDLTVQVAGAGSTETGQLMAAMRDMVVNLKDVVSKTRDASASIVSVSSKLQITSEQIASGAEEVANQTHTVATASEEMSATSNDIAQNCHEAARSSKKAMDAADTGAKVVAHTVEVMGRIADRVNNTARTVESLGSRSDQIGAIVGTIEDIADQTNLLALNAAIEAARAGEQGRGFAVVADEVRALAERTTRATKEIGSMIKAIQSETQQAVAAMEEGVREVHLGTKEAAKSGDALKEILDQINAVSMQVNQIATAAEEQTATINEITGNIHQISGVVQQTAQGSQDSAHSASQLATLSDNLSVLVSLFKLS
jgi:methyl-accepting chemotaxis protein